MAGNIVTDELIRRVEGLLESVEIRFSQTSDGTYTAATTAEPLFCFSRKTKEELAQVVADTFASYIASFVEPGAFKERDGFDVTLESVTIGEVLARPSPPPIPIHALRPYSRAKAVVRRSSSRFLQPA